MNIDVYDTYATYCDGKSIHFDVLLPQGSAPIDAERYARQWLKTLDKEGNGIHLASTCFCHCEAASPEVCEAIAADGFAILPLQS